METTVQTITTQALRDVLKAYSKPTEVKLGKITDCADFWDEFTNDVFNILPPFIDHKVQSALWRMKNEDGDDLSLVNKQGKILKRFQKAYKKHWDEKIDDATLGIIGDRLQYYVSKADKAFWADFTDCIDWDDGQFGREYSCWWGRYSDSKDVFINAGGWAIRFYNDSDDNYDNGIGRTWIFPKDKMLLCFNSYGVSRANTSKVIKALFSQHGIKLHYKQADICNSSSSEIPYINGDTGFVLYPEGLTVGNEFDLDIDIHDGKERCDNCGRYLDSEDLNYINDRNYCESCVDRLFQYCDYCESYCDKDDVHSVESGNYSYLCEDCASHLGFVECEHCGQYTEDCITEEDTENHYCESCAGKYSFYCEKCETWNSEEHDHESNDGFEMTNDAVVIGGQHYTVNLYRHADCKGLYLYNNAQIYSGSLRYSIIHESSGLVVININNLKTAKQALLDIAELGNWTRDKDTIVNDESLLNALRDIKKKYNG